MEDFNSKHTGEEVENILDSVAGKQDALVSGENIKTINGESIVGSGNITIEQGPKGEKGDKGDTGVGVQSVAQTTTSNADGGSNVVTVTLTDGTKSTFTVKNGSKGSQGIQGEQGSKGDKGDKGDTGATGANGTNGKDGADGEDGATFTPSVDSAGNLSWSNNKGLANPPTVNIKGPKGDAGEGGGSSVGSGVYSEVNHGTSDTTFALTPNTFHVWDEVSSLTLTFGSEQSGVANEYLFQFTSGATATTLSLPDDIKWANDTAPTIAESKIYQISVLRGLATVLEFNTTQALIENLCVFTGDTLIFQYPVASDLEVSLGMDKVYVSQGESRVVIDLLLEPGANIRGITPASDNTYTYIY